MTRPFAPPEPRLSPAWKLWAGVFEAYAALGGYSMDPDRMIAHVARGEGTSDLGPDGDRFREALGVYAESVDRDADTHGFGRFYVYLRLCVIAIRARLRIAPHVRAGARPRRAPIVVCGLPRSGTTMLHRLLELADDATGVPFWQLVEPMPPSRGPDKRRRVAARNIFLLSRLVPVSLDAQHVVRTDLADECGHLLRTAFVGPMPWQVPAYGWLDWSLRADVAPAYRVWAAYLSQLEPAGKRLVLKDPFHAANLVELHAACPDALVVQTHRDPIEVVPSFHKLCTTMHAVLVRRIDLPRTVAAHTRWLAHVVERNAAARATFPPAQLVDIDYRTLVADPIAAVARVHEVFRLPLTDGHVARMRAWLAENGQRKHGENPYSAEAFGQRDGEIAERFAAYRARHGFDVKQAAR